MSKNDRREPRRTPPDGAPPPASNDNRREPRGTPPLRFGTSGLRALVSEMTDVECHINTRGFCAFLLAGGQVAAGDAVSLGGDRRESTPRIMAAVARAIRDSGLEVDHQGLVPSPALALHAMGRGQASVMVTGSHIPEDRNGIKFTRPDSEVLKSDEAAILEQVAAARRAEDALDAEATLFDAGGAFKVPEGLPEPRDEAARGYVERYTAALPPGCLAGMKIVLYEHSAVGRDLFRELLGALGAQVVPAHRSETFVPVDTEKVPPRTRRLLRALALTHRPTAIFSSDGDSDRPLLTDEGGRFLPGDKLGALAAMFLRPDFAAVPISTNSAVVEALEAMGVEVARTRIGSPHVIAAMNARRAAAPRDQLCAWEANGGFLLGSPWQIGPRELAPLPTRDAVLPALCALLLAKEEGVALSRLFERRLPPRRGGAGVVDRATPGCEGYTAAVGRAIVARLTPADGDVLAARFDAEGALEAAWDGQRRPLAEERLAELREGLGEARARVAEALPERGAPGAIETLDFTDGVRVSFAGGEVLHLRPSGNAPEFRVYVEAGTEGRAAELLALKDELLARLIARTPAG